ncbi:MAG: ECF-type sigma factor, partial [Gemmatimonadota bacterium]|nr:ECF-type sigma factor [Gemmatimonadota bacterium]
DGARSTGTTSRVKGLSPPVEASTSNTERFAAQLYDELLGIAQRLLRNERAGHTLDTSAVVHEAFLRLAQQHAANWNDREHFLAAAARTMRHVLVDYARDRSAAKRNAGVQTTMISMPDGSVPAGDALDVMVLDDLLSRFAALYARAAQVVELRVFGGFEVEEVAQIIKISPNTVKRDWQFAKAWLACEMGLTK